MTRKVLLAGGPHHGSVMAVEGYHFYVARNEPTALVTLREELGEPGVQRGLYALSGTVPVKPDVSTDMSRTVTVFSWQGWM